MSTVRRRFPVPRDLASLRRAALSPAGVAVVLALLYLILNLWWVSVDQRVPNGDSGKHLNTSLGYLERFEDGQRIAWFWLWTEYPPLVHLVGMLGAALSSGDRIIGALFAQNLIFFPLLALGLYGTGKIVAGRWAGVLALVFGLAAPMVMSLFHVFMLDAPATALVAMSVWLMLLSERFTRRVPTLLAGVAVAAGFYVKPTFVLFIAGFVLVILLRGAWRNRLNLVLFAGTVFVIAAPWYLYHRDKLASQTEGAANAQQVMWYGNVPYPDRWSLDNFTWYGWNLVNNQLYLPLTLFFVVGAACAVWWVARRRAEAGVLPELLAGCVAGWFLVSLISLDDPRYSLPLLVYIAVLATWWIVRIPPRTAGLALAAVLVFFAGLNTIKQNFDYGVPFKEISFEPTDGNPIRAGQLTLWATRGYIEGSPDETGPRDEIVDLLRRAQEDGAEQVVFDPASLNNGGFNLFALAVMGRAGGLEVPGFDPAILEPNDIFVFRAQPRDLKGRPAFCLPSPLGDGTGFFMYKGVPTKASKPYCPPK